ncbi:TonB-dependent receptor [Luteimonas sp. MHLX1A]|uniref:TonB-dependent receptor n=1 Tax=Alterluteimonas muca TaxID=2878684 RepID=UPI001E388907|nr:carboxypeptidase regulatory-like domain-containing protein [Luteimonas sp. MHLX1A]MCD9045887.1 carboxypeptidase regulatory-like domain-containing protein [Luteimonas sp. MHLX1A]
MSSKHRVRLSRLSLGLIVALAAAPAFAQSTSAGVGGQVLGPNGQPVIGAEVTIVHTESGTVSRATTDASGRYNARGLRVGGPYTITINKAGEGTKTEDNVYLNLNQVNQVNAQLSGDVATLERVVVVGVAGGSEVFSATKMGTGSNVTREMIEALPSANRNIQDYIRLDPRITQTDKVDGAISAGGQNSRYNVIRIDGISSNDPFGLESNNLPTARQPVSMDAIEEISVDLANYDVTVAGGTGAVVNAVTKSGTNDFSGSVYYTIRDADWVADNLDENGGGGFTGFEKEETLGATLGGPLIRDRLFFFANYEKFTRSAPGTSFAGTPYGRGDITDADIARVQAAAQRFGFDAGGLTGPANKTDVEEYAVKFDWNINDNHRATFRYSKMEEVVPKFPAIQNSNISLSSHWYDQVKSFESQVGELFSDWSENFSTELKVSRRQYDSVANPYANLPYFRINGFGNNSNLRFGTEQNRHVNVIETDQLTAFGAANWYIGDHALKFGFDYENNDVLNFYGRNLNGVWTFANLEDFEAGRPSQYELRAPRPGRDRGDIPADYEIKNTAFFIQDTWFVNYNLSLKFGLRYDKPSFGGRPIYNPRIEELYGLDNSNTVDDGLLQPRFGFNYTFDSDRPTQLRGGVGLFQGASPNVWLAGAFQNTGLNFVEYNLRGAATPAFDPTLPPATPPGGSALLVADIMEPGLKLPSVWKANIALDHELPWYGIVASAEALFTKNNDALWFDRVDVGAPTAVGQDGRLIYWNAAGRNPANAGRFGIEHGTNGAGNRANKPRDVNQAIVVRNNSEGSAQQFTLSLSKPMLENWSWTVGYTYTHATDFSPATSSQNSSNWNNTLVFQTNQPEAYNSRYAIKDRFTGVLTWQKAFFGDNKTSVSMFYEGRSGRPFSYIFYNDVNGDSATTNDLFYVPNGYGDVLFTGGAAMEQSFFDWLNQNPELKSYQGGVAPANAFRASWVNSFDVRISQEFPGFMDGHKAEVSLDIMNFGNLLNKDWGHINDYGFFATRRVANYAGIDPATGKYIYNFTGRTDNESLQEVNNDGVNTAVSRWSVMLGLRYRF